MADEYLDSLKGLYEAGQLTKTDMLKAKSWYTGARLSRRYALIAMITGTVAALASATGIAFTYFGIHR